MAKKLILGGNGLQGSAIMRQLMADGEDVRVLVRGRSGTRNLDGVDVEIVHGDITDGDSIRAAARGCDTMYFTAAHFSHYNPKPQLAYDVNVGGTRTTLRAAEESGVERVVYTSTNCTMGAHGPVPVDEDAEFNHWKTRDHYSISKYLGEIEALRFAARGFPVVIVNPTYVIGAGDARPTSSGQLLIDVANGNGQLSIDGHLNIIDVEDVARGHILAAEKGRSGERYLFGNENTSIRGFMNLIADVAGVPRPKLTVPFPIALSMAYVAEGWARMTRSQPWETIAALKIGHMGETYDCAKAVEELGLPQTPIEESVRRAIDWFRANGYVKPVAA